MSRFPTPAATRERIALAVTVLNRCDHCLSAHIFPDSQHVALNTWTDYLNSVSQEPT